MKKTYYVVAQGNMFRGAPEGRETWVEEIRHAYMFHNPDLAQDLAKVTGGRVLEIEILVKFP